MNSYAIAILVLACTGFAAGQTSYSGQTYTFAAQIAARNNIDLANVTGYTRFRTEGGTAFFESALNNAQLITAVHLHLTPQRGVVDGGPLVLALTNTTATPLSFSGNQPLVQIGNVTNTNLAASPMLAAARAGIVALGIHDNTLQNIGDVDRLARAGVLYGDVHSTIRLSPNRVGSGLVTLFTPTTGRKMI